MYQQWQCRHQLLFSSTPFIFSTHLLAFFMYQQWQCYRGHWLRPWPHHHILSLGLLRNHQGVRVPGSGATFCDLFAFFAFFFFTARSGCDVGGGSANFTLLVYQQWSLRRWGREERKLVRVHGQTTIQNRA